jgi:hypothetical protein
LTVLLIVFSRKFGNHVFFLSKDGPLMFWGGTFSKTVSVLQQRWVGKAPANANNRNSNLEHPLFEFSILPGVAMKSK